MKRVISVKGLLFILLCSVLVKEVAAKEKMVFAVMGERRAQLDYILLMAESIRTFGGQFKEAPIWVYLPPALMELSDDMQNKFDSFGMEIKEVEAPPKSMWYYFSRKVYAAAKAEEDALDEYEFLAWLNYDTILLNEPLEFVLPEKVSLGYRPVMHKNIGLLYNEPLDEFWQKSFTLMSVDEKNIFPVVTPADGDSIKPYINAGCLIVRPEKRIMKEWIGKFEELYNDARLTELCGQDRLHRIFIHQVALTGVLLNYLNKDEFIELSEYVNYPFFFKEMFGSKKDFHDVTGVITFRHEAFFNNPEKGWQEKLKGPKDKVDWIIAKLGN
jgi:hypothetical protein